MRKLTEMLDRLFPADVAQNGYEKEIDRLNAVILDQAQTIYRLQMVLSSWATEAESRSIDAVWERARADALAEELNAAQTKEVARFSNAMKSAAQWSVN